MLRIQDSVTVSLLLISLTRTLLQVQTCLWKMVTKLAMIFSVFLSVTSRLPICVSGYFEIEIRWPKHLQILSIHIVHHLQVQYFLKPGKKVLPLPKKSGL